MDAAFDGRIFSWQPKGIETDGKENIVALHALEACGRVGRGHSIPVTDVQVA